VSLTTALAVVDELAVSRGKLFRGDDLLTMMAAGLEPPESSPGPG
jgi:hypothetical protein